MQELERAFKRGRQAILRIRWGPLACRRSVIASGQSIRVGRAVPSEFMVPHDEQLASSHFELGWDGTRCLLRDLSGKGTWLGGERVQAGEVPHGGWLRAGGTDFSFYVERSSPLAALRREVVATLRSLDLPLYAILDASRSSRLLELLRESVEDYRSLYEGARGDALEDVAPYLVALPRDSLLLDSLITEGWGRRWGIYLTSPLSLDEVRRHLRHFLWVRVEDSPHRSYFRLYDPAYLESFLTVCTLEEQQRFFGGIHSFLYEHDQVLRRLDTPGSVTSTMPGLFELRSTHVQSLKAAVTRSFEDRLIAWLRRNLSQFCREMNEVEIRYMIQYALSCARRYRMLTEKSACIYVGTMFVCGHGFDLDLAWSAEILNSPDYATSADRAQALALALERQTGVHLSV